MARLRFLYRVESERPDCVNAKLIELGRCDVLLLYGRAHFVSSQWIIEAGFRFYILS